MTQYRVLHLEESVIDAARVQLALQKEGLNFEYFLTDTDDGFKNEMEAFKPHVILCDYCQPDFGSFKVLNYFMQSNIEIAFIIVTDRDSEEFAAEMMRMGVDDYILKKDLNRLPGAILNSCAKKEKYWQQKQAEVRLAQREALLNKSQKLAHIGSWELDLITQKGIWSDELYNILGLQNGQIQATREQFLTFVHPQDIVCVRQNLDLARREQCSISLHFRIIRKDGAIRHVYYENNFEFDSNNKPNRINGIVQDITANVLANKQKEFDQKNLYALINNTTDFMWSVDRNFRLITSNQAFKMMVRVVFGEVVEDGKSMVFRGFQKDLLERFKGYYVRAIAGEEFTEIEYHDSNWAEISFSPIFGEGEIVGAACYSRDITKLKKAELDSLRKNKHLRNLTTHLNRVREDERTTISREIHDELGQQLTALKMDIDWILHKQTNPDEMVVDRLKEMLKMSDGVINTIRRISADLRPAMLDDLGLIAALEWKCTDFEKKANIPCKFTSSVRERRFESNFGIITFRILQETLTNISRHANANNVSVSVSETEKELLLEITDNGKGISDENLGNGKSLGILGMKERASMIGGELIIKGKQGQGTTTNVILPFEYEYTNS